MHGLADQGSGRGDGRPLCWRATMLAAVGLAIAGGAFAQDAPAAPGTVDGLLETLQIKGRAAPAAPFVTESRPKQAPDFVPVSTPHADRPVKVKSAAEIAAMEADLDAARIRQQRRAGQVPPIVPLKQQSAGKSGKDTVR